MKYLQFLIIVLSFTIIISCIENERTEKQLLGRDLNTIYKTNPDKDTTLKGVNGTIIEIPGNSFLFENGEEPADSIEINFEDFYNKKDFLKNRLSTITKDGDLLQSSGMVYLEANLNRRKLVLKEDKPIRINFKRVFTSPEANLFYGVENDENVIEWEISNEVYKDTTLYFEESRYIRGRYTDNIRFADSIYIEAMFVIGYDTLEVDSNNIDLFRDYERRYPERINRNYKYDEDTANIDNQTYNEFHSKYYSFVTSNLGWINCDIFIEEELHEFEITMNEENAELWVVFDSLNSVTSLYKSMGDKYYLDVPKNQNVKLIAYKNKGDEHLFGITNANTSMEYAEIETKSIDLDSIDRILEKNIKGK